MFHDRFKSAELDKVYSSRFAEDKSFSERLQRKSWVSSPIEYCSHRTLFNYSKQKSNHLGIINSVRFIIREVKVGKEKKGLPKKEIHEPFRAPKCISSSVTSLCTASPREGNLGTTEMWQKLPADSPKKASAWGNPPYWKKAKVEAFVNTCTFRSLFYKAIVKKAETCIESLKLHLTPKWIRQEKESLSTVPRGLFRSKMKRVSTAVY